MIASARGEGGTTAAGGSILGSDCSNWTCSSSGAQTTTVGVGSNTTSAWSQAYLISCSRVPLARLYCFQQ